MRKDRNTRGVVLAFAAATLAAGFAAAGCSNDSDRAGDTSSTLTDGGVSVPADARDPSCTVQLPTACPDPPTTFEDLQPIIDAKCVSCHNDPSGVGPWPLSDYEHVSDWADFVRSDIYTCAMPPSDAGATLTNDERLVFLNWVRCGVPK
jgi:hypothetical protein